MNKSKVDVKISSWNGKYNIVTLESEKIEVQLLSFGATIHSVTYKDSKTDVILGFDEVSGYDQTENPFFWGTTGRFTNRVKNGKFKIAGQEYQLSKNDFGNNNRNHLHGGNRNVEEGDGI